MMEIKGKVGENHFVGIFMFQIYASLCKVSSISKFVLQFPYSEL